MTTFSAEERKKLAKQGKAMPDGSYPTPALSNLEDAVQAYGRETGDRSALKSYLTRRAVALQASSGLKQRIRNLKA